jgi:ketosteroid isomerase-like protein
MLKPLPLALAALLAAPAAAQAPPSPNAEIVAVAQAFDAAQQQGDRAALERMLAPDFLIVHGSGKVGGRQDFIDGWTQPTTRLQLFAITDRLFLRIGPDAAVVGGEGRVKGTDGGKPFARHFRYSDTFVRRDGRWLAIFTQVTPLPD